MTYTWGNPYPITNTNDRETVIRKYSVLLDKQVQSGTISIAELQALNGKTLGCFCKPQPCHGDVIVEMVKWAMNKNIGEINE